MYWDEDTRLMVLSDNGKTSRYTYNAAGERIVKSHGDLEGVYINGAPQGISFHETEDYTIYPAPIITVTKNRFTKHYFIGSKRIASKIGTGRFSNVYGIGGNNITAGQKDYAARMMQIEKQREEYYKQLGTPPGVPTMKGATADPDNTGIGYNSIITDLGDHSVPEGWIQHPKFNGKGDVPGPPIQWSEPESPDNAQPGYGYIPADTTDTEDIFFYHSDHLGSTSYITDAKANITQFDAYLPYGELLVDEHTSSEDMPYKFNGKEFDEETGLYYYGARYMNPVSSLWYGVDTLAEKYPSISGYVYCVGNPIKCVDLDGKAVWLFATKLPGTHVPLATHTFLVVTGDNGKVLRYAAYGPQNGNPIGGDKLTECHYQQDQQVFTDFFKGKLNENLKGHPQKVKIPKGMTSNEFDKKVIQTINSFGNIDGITYTILGGGSDKTSGNCNTSSSTILIKAGVNKEEMKSLESNIEGINTGFQTCKPKPWTKKEQEKALKEKNNSNRFKAL